MKTEPQPIVTFTTLYPSREQPYHGVFVEHRLRRLVQTRRVVSRVIAPIPWFPFPSTVFGRYATYARIPRTDNRYGIDVVRPRYLALPRVGMNFAPILMATAARSEFRRLLRSGYEFTAIDAHYFYPDGVAAAIIGRHFGKPVVITARGTDINLIPKFPIARRQILWAAKQCTVIIAVCQALKDTLVEMGVSESKVNVLRNGVDLTLFSPVEREEARRKIGLAGSGKVLLSVGHLIERKGHHIAIDALRQIPDTVLVIVGDGEMKTRLQDLARTSEVSQRVKFVGSVRQSELKYYYSAASALVLASSREGIPNVVLESLACGTPAIATASWGTPEVITEPAAGVLMTDRSASALEQAVSHLFSNYPARQDTRRFGEKFNWDSTTEGQLEVFGRFCDKS